MRHPGSEPSQRSQIAQLDQHRVLGAVSQSGRSMSICGSQDSVEKGTYVVSATAPFGCRVWPLRIIPQFRGSGATDLSGRAGAGTPTSRLSLKVLAWPRIEPRPNAPCRKLPALALSTRGPRASAPARFGIG